MVRNATGKIIIAVDIGTTSTKVLALNADRYKGAQASKEGVSIRARAEEGYPLLEPHPGHFEQDPGLIAEAVERSIREVMRKGGIQADEVACLTFSSAMHGLIAVDGAGEALTPCVTWADLRAAGYAKKLRDSGEAGKLTMRTGVPVHAMTPLCKLLWLRDNEPEIFASARCFIGIKEFVLHRWFEGPYLMDESVAGGTGLYHLEDRKWDEQALQLAGVGLDKLPQLVPSEHVLQGLRQAAADAMLLSADVPVIVGAADGVLANLGAGAVESGIAAVTIGTSGAVRIALDTPAADREGRLFCYPLADSLWIAGGPVNSGGVVLRWLRDKLFPAETAAAAGQGIDPYEQLIALAMETPPGAEGLLSLPHLAGERAPHWDENARGVYIGLSLHHDRRHMIRATLEGILFGLRAVAELVAASSGGGPLREIRASGGFARSGALRQMMADIFGCPVTLTDTEDASAIGAAMLAQFALGQAPHGLRGLAAAVEVVDRRDPDPQAAAVYDRLFPVYRSLYSALAPAFAEIAAYQRGE